MELHQMAVLTGKYIITSKISEDAEFYTYRAKAPSIGEEFLITEFFPQKIASRGSEDFVVVSPDNADEYESFLHKFTNDAQTLTKLRINRFLHIVDVITEKGTVYVISKNLPDNPVSKSGEAEMLRYSLTDYVLDTVFDGLKECAEHGIYLDFNEETVYSSDNGLLVFAFLYRPKIGERGMLGNMARLFQYLVSSYNKIEKTFDSEEFWVKSKYTSTVRDLLSNGKILAFSDIELQFKNAEKTKKAANMIFFGPHFKSVLILAVILMVILAAIIYAAFSYAGVLFG